MKRTIMIAALILTALAPTAAMAAEGGEGQGSWLTFALFVINFSVFVALIVRYAAPMVRKFFLDRAHLIRTELERAQGAVAEAQEMADKAAARMAALERELKELADNLERETRYHLDRIAETGRSTVERIRRDAEMSATGLSDAAQRRLRSRLAGAAAQLAREMIARQFQSQDQSRLIDGFMDKLSQESGR
jgi:F-type H+-transporting ATPase subunit b